MVFENLTDHLFWRLLLLRSVSKDPVDGRVGGSKNAMLGSCSVEKLDQVWIVVDELCKLGSIVSRTDHIVYCSLFSGRKRACRSFVRQLWLGALAWISVGRNWTCRYTYWRCCAWLSGAMNWARRYVYRRLWLRILTWTIKNAVKVEVWNRFGFEVVIEPSLSIEPRHRLMAFNLCHGRISCIIAGIVEIIAESDIHIVVVISNDTLVNAIFEILINTSVWVVVADQTLLKALFEALVVGETLFFNGQTFEYMLVRDDEGGSKGPKGQNSKVQLHGDSRWSRAIEDVMKWGRQLNKSSSRSPRRIAAKWCERPSRT